MSHVDIASAVNVTQRGCTCACQCMSLEGPETPGKGKGNITVCYCTPVWSWHSVHSFDSLRDWWSLSVCATVMHDIVQLLVTY